MTRTKHAKALEQMHGSLIEALRSREQEIFRYLAILGPALGGFGWLYYKAETTRDFAVALFTFGTVSSQLLLLLGAVYSVTRGYNFRYALLELAKIESVLGIRSAMLVGWPKCREKFQKPWCLPPEMIQVFWIAFLLGIVVVTIAAAAYLIHDAPHNLACVVIVVAFGIICAFIGLVCSKYYGRKLTSLATKEPAAWPQRLEEEDP